MNKTGYQELDKHVTVLGWLYIGLSIFTLFIGVFSFIALLGTGLLSSDSEAMGVLAIVGVFVLGLMSVISIPGIIAGWGLLKRKSWARLLALVIGFLNLMSIPFGTLLGGYTIWALLIRDDASSYFLAYNS